MIYITGDLHGEIDKAKLTTKNFPAQRELTKNDYVIIAGDFGGIWSGGKQDEWLLDWLESRNFTTLFVDGNHENFDLLYQFPIMDWNGGKIHQIRPSIIHLMRGQVFTIEGKKIFTFGGAESVDKQFRKEFISWWREEIPSRREFEEGIRNLEKHDMTVDYVITHTAPRDIIGQLNSFFGDKINDSTSEMLNYFKKSIRFKHWFFGHFHTNKTIGKFTVLNDRIVVLQENVCMPKDPEPRDWKIEKYRSKFKAAFPDMKQPTYEEAGALIDQWDREGRHITYPLAGLNWNELEWKKEYRRKREFKLLAEKIINHQTDGEENFMACGNGEQCPQSDNCKCWKLYQYMLENEIAGHTCQLNKPENCKEFRPYGDK